MGDFGGDFNWGVSDPISYGFPGVGYPSASPGTVSTGGSSGNTGVWGFLTNLLGAATGAYQSTLQADTQQAAIAKGYSLSSIFGLGTGTTGSSSIVSLLVVLVVVILIWKAVSK